MNTLHQIALGVSDLDRASDFSGPPQLIHSDVDGTFGMPGTEEWMAFLRDPDGNARAIVESRKSSAA